MSGRKQVTTTSSLLICAQGQLSFEVALWQWVLKIKLEGSLIQIRE